MPNPIQPDNSLAPWMNDIERRLRALETAPGLAFSSVKNGSIDFYDGSTPPKLTARIGKQTDGNVGLWFYNTTTGLPVLKLGANTDGTFDLRTLNAASQVLVRLGMVSTTPEYGFLTLTPGGVNVMKLTAAGQIKPKLEIPSGGQNFFISLTASASYVEMFRSDVYLVGQKMDWDMTVMANGSTMDYEITLVESGVTENDTTTVVSTELTITVNAQRQVTGLDLSTTPGACWVGGVAPTAAECAGKFVTLRWKARRTAGATNVGIALNSAPRNYAT